MSVLDLLRRGISVVGGRSKPFPITQRVILKVVETYLGTIGYGDNALLLVARCWFGCLNEEVLEKHNRGQRHHVPMAFYDPTLYDRKVFEWRVASIILADGVRLVVGLRRESYQPGMIVGDRCEFPVNLRKYGPYKGEVHLERDGQPMLTAAWTCDPQTRAIVFSDAKD